MHSPKTLISFRRPPADGEITISSAYAKILSLLMPTLQPIYLKTCFKISSMISEVFQD